MPLDRIVNRDAFEVVRDTMALILATESTNQMALAVSESDDPEQWQLKVYTERANPWEHWLNDPETAPPAPIVNVWFDSDGFEMGAGNVVEYQAAEGTFNVDVYGFGVSTDETVGHTPGDEKAAQESHRGARLARAILMASEYTYLGLRPLVSRRWLQSRTSFQPQMETRPTVHIAATRLAFRVKYLEVSPQYEGQLLELLAVSINRAQDGRVLAELEYDKT